MPYSPRVKQLAYAADPTCWESYSGMPPSHKRRMDARRKTSLEGAERFLAIRDKIIGRYLISKIQPTLEKIMPAAKPWNAFKMKIMLHIGSYAGTKWSYLHVLSPLEDPKSQRARVSGYSKIVRELAEEGLVDPKGGPHFLPCPTAKGKVFVEAVLSTPLPVQTAPQWVMPS